MNNLIKYKIFACSDLSKNNITKLAPDAFSGLKALNSL